MFYNKRIAYMDYYEDGVKTANAGFVRLLKSGDGRRDGSHEERTSLQIHISNFPLRGMNREAVKLRIGSREIVLGQIEIQDRKGMLQIHNLEEVLAKAEIGREESRGMGLQVEWTPGKMLLCELEPEHKKVEPKEAKAEEKRVEPGLIEEYREEFQGAMEEFREEEYQEEYQIEKRQEGYPGEKGQEEYPEQKRQEEYRRQARPEYITREVVTAEEPAPEQSMTAKISGVQQDKWKQLSEIFPHIRPFQDEREYLRLELRDLVVLPKLYYRLVENSFLLHGYYNYEHLILTKMRKRGGEKYYIGVPGNYYEKEKQVAVLFGFESFEPKTEPAGEADFGYYMIGVDI